MKNDYHQNAIFGEFSVISPTAKFGEGVVTGTHCYIGPDVAIGNNVKIGCGVHLSGNIQIKDNAVINNCVVFDSRESTTQQITIVEENAELGAACTIYAGIRIGQSAKVEPGSCVTLDIPSNAIVSGNPAKIVGYRNSPQFSSAPAQTEQVATLDNKPVTLLPACSASLIRFWNTEDLRGQLSVGVFERDLPFTPRRFFVVYDIPTDKLRGEHAHIDCEQLLICTSGSCNVLIDDGHNRCEVTLDDPKIGLYLPKMVWASQYKHSSNTSLLVFASHDYDESDYIRDYGKFLQRVSASEELS